MVINEEPVGGNESTINVNTVNDTTKHIDLKCRERVGDSDMEDSVFDYRTTNADSKNYKVRF